MNNRAMAKKYFPHLRILGDFAETKYAKITEQEKALMSVEELDALEQEAQQFFADSRQHGLDNSVYPFGVGGSDAGTIFSYGFTPPSELYEKKRRYETQYRFKKETKETQETFDSGHFAEPSVRKQFERRSGLKTIDWTLQVVNPKYPHCIGNVDGLVIENGKIGIYEGKWSAAPEKRAIWRGLSKELKQMARLHPKHRQLPSPLVIPEEYLLQTWFYMAIYEVEFAYICGGWGYALDEIGYTRVPRLPKDKEEELMQTCEDFVMATAKGERPSDIDYANKKKVLKSYKETHINLSQNNKVIAFPTNAAITAETFIQLKSEVKKLKKQIEDEVEGYKQTLLEKYKFKEKEAALESAECYFAEKMYDKTTGIIDTDDGFYAISYVTAPGPKRTFQKSICEEKYPEIMDEVYFAKPTRQIKIIKKSNDAN